MTMDCKQKSYVIPNIYGYFYIHLGKNLDSFCINFPSNFFRYSTQIVIAIVYLNFLYIPQKESNKPENKKASFDKKIK